MEAYGGFEPEVGEIQAVRTFRIGPGGVLYPLFGNRPWTAGTNTSFCTVLQPTHHELTWVEPHAAPDPECNCGFYAYADEASAAEYPQSQHVLGVISCWGKVIAGTRGVRVQHARIEALWMSPRVPPELKAAVAARYPEMSVYESKTSLLIEHPATLLDCYELPTPRQRAVRRRGEPTLLLAALAVGSLPPNWIWQHHEARLVWAAEVAFFSLAAAFLLLIGRGRRASISALPYAAVILWLIAPLAGGAGFFLLRLPILQIALLGQVHRAQLQREASRFPAPISPTFR